MENLFSNINQNWVSTVFKLTDDPDQFKDLVEKKEKSVEEIYNYLSTLCSHFLKVVTDEADPLSGIPEVKEAVCINRLLGKNSLETLSTGVAQILKQQLYDNFYFGLLGTLYFCDFPSRDKYYLVDINLLEREWERETIVADWGLRGYTDSIPLFKVIYEYNFANDYRPFLKSNIGVGMFRMGKYKSFYRNINFAGALLVVMCDLATKKVKDKEI